MDFTLRAWRNDDVPALLALIQVAFARYRGRIDPPSSAEHKTIEIVRAELETSDARVAEFEDRVVGCVFFRAQGDAMYLDRLAVRPEFQRLGIANALLAEVECAARERGLTALSLSVRIPLVELQRFYLKRGFEVTGTATHAGYTEPTTLRLRKPLRLA